MNPDADPDSDPQPDLPTTTFIYDRTDVLTRYSYVVAPEEPAFSFEHDAQKGIFRLSWPDGKVEVFRDKPARHLVVKPDPETGEIKPVLQRGQPTYLYLCREEREIR